MIRVLKIGNLIYENFEPKILVPTKYDENGNPIEFREELVEFFPKTQKELAKAIADTLSYLEFKRLQEVLDQYGYKDLGDVQYWHSQDPDDPEPKGLLEWYSAYDDAIWEEIDNLQNKTFEELKDYDPVAVENQIFERTKEKLPPMED